jgi:hypothetical protein
MIDSDGVSVKTKNSKCNHRKILAGFFQPRESNNRQLGANPNHHVILWSILGSQPVLKDIRYEI